MNDQTETTPPYTITSPILDLVERIGEAIGRAEEAASRTNLRLRRANRIRSIRGSLAIEGNTLTEEQISTIFEGRPVVAPLREIQEVRNAIKAYERFTQWNPASQTDLLTAHQMLMVGLLDSPGHYRRGGIAVAGAGEVHHIGPPAERVPYLMSDLLTWLENTEEHPLIASSVFHYEFEFIHPFEDGNGRMGRLWQNLILTRWKPLFADVPVESLIYERQSAYYETIRQSSAKGESTPFIVFMLEAILDAVISTPQETPHVSPPSRASTGRPGRRDVTTADSARSESKRPKILPAKVSAASPGERLRGNDSSRIAHCTKSEVSTHGAWANGKSRPSEHTGHSNMSSATTPKGGHTTLNDACA